jgi:TrmH RNA methyltransferase
MEYVQIYEVNALVPFVKQLRSRFLLTGTTVRGGRSLDSAKPPRAPGRPVALLLGNEETGLDPQLISLCELRVHIAGGGAIESLNVSAAAAILLQWVAAGRRNKLEPRETADGAPVVNGQDDADVDDVTGDNP